MLNRSFGTFYKNTRVCANKNACDLINVYPLSIFTGIAFETDVEFTQVGSSLAIS